MSIWEGVVIMVIKNGAGANFVQNKYSNSIFQEKYKFYVHILRRVSFPFYIISFIRAKYKQWFQRLRFQTLEYCMVLYYFIVIFFLQCVSEDKFFSFFQTISH